MMKRMGLTLLSLVLLWSLGCSESVVSTDATNKPFSHWAFGREVVDPGKVHNQIVEGYASLRPFDNSTPLERAEFVRCLKKAANDALASNRLPEAVREVEVGAILDYFEKLRTAGVYDLFAPARSNIYNVVDHLEQEKALSQSDAEMMRRVIAAAHNGDAKTVSDIFRSLESPSETLVAFMSIYRASSKVWSGYDFKANPKFRPRPERLSDASDGVLMDAIGGALGYFLGGPWGGMIGSAALSIMWHEMPPGDGDSFNCNYCDLA